MGTLQFRFSKILVIVVSRFPMNKILICACVCVRVQYTYIKRWHWYNVCRHSFLKGAAIVLFPKNLRSAISRRLLNEIVQKFMCKICVIRNHKDTFTCIYLSGRYCYSVFSKILVIVVSRLLLHGILQNFTCNIQFT